MEEQMKQQFEQFQNGFKAVFETGPKMVEPVLRSGEVAIDSLSQLVKDQFEFSRSCLDISRRQLDSLAKSNDVTAVFRDQSASSEFYTAAMHYGEALRQNAESTRERMATIGREATDTAANVSAQAYQAAAAQGEKATKQAASTAEKAANKAG